MHAQEAFAGEHQGDHDGKLTSSSFSSRNFTTGSLVMALSTMRWHSSVLMPRGFGCSSFTSDDMYSRCVKAAHPGRWDVSNLGYIVRGDRHIA